jgi:integration host factor subunit beta
MNKSELIEELASRANITLTAADKIVSEVFGSMADTLAAGGRIEIRGFGSLVVKEYEGYTGRNPKTGLHVTVNPKKLPFFKVGKDLKERILDSGK